MPTPTLDDSELYAALMSATEGLRTAVGFFGYFELADIEPTVARRRLHTQARAAARQLRASGVDVRAVATAFNPTGESNLTRLCLELLMAAEEFDKTGDASDLEAVAVELVKTTTKG